jgi:hypothetical protein
MAIDVVIQNVAGDDIVKNVGIPATQYISFH